MLEQLLIAYAAGMTLAVSMEAARVVKARRLNRESARRTAMAPEAAPRYSSVAPMVATSAPGAAANEPEFMRAAG